MSGHDIAAKPHKTTHEKVWDMGDTAHMAGAGRKPLLPLKDTPPAESVGSGEGSLRGIPHVSIPVQWTRWPKVKPRAVPAREQRRGPRASRFNDLEHA